MQTVDKNPITLGELKAMASVMFNNIVKAVIDIEQEIMVVDAQFHSDQEEYLLERGSQQEHLWGINLHPEFFGTPEFVEFDSMINIRPNDHNMSRGIEDPHIQEKIRSVVAKMVSR
jgi:hypothetical protein